MENSIYAALKTHNVRVTRSKVLAFIATLEPDWTNDRLAAVVGYKQATSLSEPKLASQLKRWRQIGRLNRGGSVDASRHADSFRNSKNSGQNDKDLDD